MLEEKKNSVNKNIIGSNLAEFFCMCELKREAISNEIVLLETTEVEANNNNRVVTLPTVGLSVHGGKVIMCCS
jgi:hypothetical protein